MPTATSEYDALVCASGTTPRTSGSTAEAICGCWDEFRDATLPNNCVKGVKWSPDGLCLLTASEDRQLRLFELPDAAAATAAAAELRSVVRVREGDGIYDYAWYPLMHSTEAASCCFLSASRDHPLHLWDAYTGALRASYAAYDHLDEVTSAYCAAFEPTGRRIYAGFERTVRIFDVTRPGRGCEARPTCATKKSRDGQRGIISCLGFAPDGSGLYAAGSFAGTTGLYAENAPGLVTLLGGHRGGVTQASFSDDGLLLLTAARRDDDIIVWDVRRTGTELARLPRAADTNQRIGFHISADSKGVVSASRDGRVLACAARNPAHAIRRTQSGALRRHSRRHADPSFSFQVRSRGAGRAARRLAHVRRRDERRRAPPDSAVPRRRRRRAPIPAAARRSQRRRRRRQRRRRPRGGGGGGGRGPQRVPSVAALGDRTAGGGRRRERGRRTCRGGCREGRFRRGGGRAEHERGRGGGRGGGRSGGRRWRRGRGGGRGGAEEDEARLRDGPSHILSASVDERAEGGERGRPGLPRPRAAKKNENMQHSAFPRGPPPQYYPSSNQLIFPVRMGRVDPG